jgi:hypothetical protein
MARMPPFGPGFSGYVELPYLPASVTVGDALDAMVAARRAAAIVSVGEHHYLHLARSVIDKGIDSRKSLETALPLTRPPYLPVVDVARFPNWLSLRPDYESLLGQGVMYPRALPPSRPPLGGLIAERRGDLAWLLAALSYPVDDLAAVLTKCVCTAGCRVLPEDLVNGACPNDGLPVVCGTAP